MSDEKEEKKAPDDGGGDDDDEGGSGPKRLEKGDYMILVHLIEGRELKGVDFGDSSDPMVEIKVMDQKKNSSVIKEQQTVIWDERFQFSFPNLDPEELNVGKVSLSCFDANMIRKNVLIGKFEFDLVSIYYREHNEMYKQWIALTDVTDKREGVQGYLQVTITVLGPGDEEYIHPPEEELNLEGGILNVMMPPQIDPDPWLLRVHVYKIEKIPIMDKLNKSTDPYAMVEYAGVKEKLKYQKKTLDYEPNKTINVPVMEPILSDTIDVSIKDWDADSFGNTDKDDLIGKVTYSWKDVKDGGIDCHWFHMYGTPPGEDDGKLGDKMNRGIIEGVWYRGSVLCRLEARKEDEPKKEVTDALWNSQLQPRLEEWCLQLDIYMGVECKDLRGDYAIEMRFRQAVWRTAYCSANNRGSIEWFEILTDDGVDPTKQDYIRLRAPEDIKQCPDVIFYVIKKKQGITIGKSDCDYISYYRFSFKELVDFGWQSKPRWFEFKENKKLTKLKEKEYPGTILMGIRCGKYDDKPNNVALVARPFLNVEDMNKPSELDLLTSGEYESKQNISLSGDDTDVEAPLLSKSLGPGPRMQVGILQLTIIEADDVPITDRDGASDPYVIVELPNEKPRETKVIKDTLNPVWHEEFTFKGISIQDEFKLTLKDHNKISKNFTIGVKDNISLQSLYREAKSKNEKGWNCTKKFFISQEYPTCTLSISVKFTYDSKQVSKRKAKQKKNKGGFFSNITKNTANQQTLNLKRKGKEIMGTPYNKNYKLLMHCYVARDIEAADTNGLADPYLVISYCGVTVNTGEKDNKNTLNPQFMKTLSLNVDVPQPAEFAPRIRCLLYDYDWGPNPDDLLAKFEIPFTKVISMMKNKKADWFKLKHPQGKYKLAGKVYIAAEFVDPNSKSTPIFKIDTVTDPYDLHLLTIGVRSLKSGFGVSKPQIGYALPIAGETTEVATNPSSDPEPKNANFLVTKKVQVNCPRNYELAPVLNIVCRDHKFGGIIKNDIGTTALNLQQFMIKSKDPMSTEWWVNEERKTILNEQELKVELAAEFDAETRECASEERVRILAQRKVKELTEVRCAQRNYDEKEHEDVKNFESQPVDILSDEQIKEIEEIRQLAQSSWKPKVRKRDEETGEIIDSDVGSDGPVPVESDTDEEDTDEKTELVYKGNENAIELENTKSVQSATSAQSIDEEEILLKKKKEKQQQLQQENDETKIKEHVEETDMKDIAQDGENKGGKGVDPNKGKEEKAPSNFFEKLKAKREQEKKLQEWDKQDEDLCYDLDAKVTFNPDDFKPEYLIGRNVVGDDLEDVMDLRPFDQLDLFTGSVGGLKLFGQDRRQVGSIKGLWKLTEKDQDPNPFGNGLKNLVTTQTIACRVYILEGIHLFSTDSDGKSDPYLIIRLGRNKISTRDHYHKNTLDPKFHEAFEFHTRLPGACNLDIELWDWDGIGDDLIGKTTIDIENRWFSKDWRRIRMKPLEQRNIYNPRSQRPYGKVSLWVDLMTKDEARNTDMVDISLPPDNVFEFRIIVWKAQDVVIKDTITDQNDLRVTTNLKMVEKQQQETDTHWRAKFGKGSWNWRLIFPVQLPCNQKTQLNMSMWDQDIFSASDSIGESNISLDLLFLQMYKQKDEKPRLILRKDTTKRFWLDFTHPNFEGVQGKVQVSMEIMTADEATKFPAGIGRSDPNNNPFLPEPEGRLKFTLNPFSMLRQLLGDKCCFKLYLICCVLGCLAILIFAGPQIIITILSSSVTSLLGFR